MSATVKHDGTVSQRGREDSIVSGRQPALSATRTPRGVNSSSVQLDDNGSMSERRPTRTTMADTRRSDDTGRTAQRPPTHRPDTDRTSERLPSHRPSTASGRCRRALRHNISDSYVDESLFGPVADDTSAAPWQPNQRPVKPFIFDCTDYRAKAANTSNVPSSSRRSRPQSARLHSQPSFVDESLFGDQLELSTWRAPWEKKDRRPKPLIFDATNYRKQQQQRAASSETRFRCAASAKQRPPWR